MKDVKKYHYEYTKKRYCCDDLSLIENYSKTIDSSDIWDLHHRLETHNSDGILRSQQLTKQELIALDMYWNRPASELIFLTHAEHAKLHLYFMNIDKSVSQEVRNKISKSVRNNPEANGGKAKRMREAYNKDNKGLSWNEFQHKFKEIL